MFYKNIPKPVINSFMTVKNTIIMLPGKGMAVIKNNP